MISSRAAGVDLWLPEDWVVHAWTLDNPETGLSHVMDVQTGLQVAVRRVSCTSDDVERWRTGDAIEDLVGHRVDEIQRAPDSLASLMPDAAAFVTTSLRDSITYSALTFLNAAAGRCFLVELIGPDSIFDQSFGTFSLLADGIKLRQDAPEPVRLSVNSADTATAATFEISMPDGDPVRVSTPFEFESDDENWHGLIREVEGHTGLRAEVESRGWRLDCTGTTIFVERRGEWGFCTGM
jgi:hypothetical protein